jgi:hypothetical protein
MCSHAWYYDEDLVLVNSSTAHAHILDDSVSRLVMMLGCQKMERKYGAVPLHSPTSDSNPNPAFSRCSKREATIPLGGYFSYQSVTYNTTANSIIYRNKTQLQISSRCANHKPALPAVSFLPTDHQGRRPLQRTRLTLSQPSPPGSDAVYTSPW